MKLNSVTFALISVNLVCSNEQVTWIDNDDGNIISLDGDQGWAIYECEDTYDDCGVDISVDAYCTEPSDCTRQDDSGIVYYGPFNNEPSDSKWMMRRFACEYVQCLVSRFVHRYLSKLPI